MNVRLTPEVKSRISRAAHILGQDLTEFTSHTLSLRADEVIENHEQILLSEKDYEFFITQLEKPAKLPSDYTRKIRDSYYETFGRD